jgi:hypothetical protein
MSEWAGASPCASNRSSVGLAATSLLLLVFGSFFVLRIRADNWDAPFAPVFGYEVRGVTYSGFDGARLAGAHIDCGIAQTSSDAQGRFVVDFGFRRGWLCRFSAPGFEPQEVRVGSGDMLAVRLVPDPVWTVSRIVEWERTGQFESQYDLLHPDVNRSWTREEFVRLLSLTENQPLLESEIGRPYFLERWDHYGEVYHHVAVVPTWLTFEENGEARRYYWEAHLVKHNGLWRWFRETPTKLPSGSGQLAHGAE